MGAARREPPADLVARLRAYPDFVEVRFNELLYRWEFVFTSTTGRPTSQFFGWEQNPLTGQRLEPDPVTGLLPFRDLTPEACNEIVANCERTFIGNPEGPGTFRRQADAARRHNRDLVAQRARERAATYADLIAEVDLRRPWKKHHTRSTTPLYFLPSRKRAVA